MPHALSQRASQKPSRPASKATAIRSIRRPAFSASSRHRYSSFSNVLSSTASFFNGWRSTPGTMPATSQLDRLISMTAISVPSGSRAVRDRLRSFNFCMVRSIGSHQRRWMQYPRRRPIASSIMGFEDEAEQSLGRPCRYTNGRSKRTLALRARALAPKESKQNRPPLDEPPIAQPRQGESSGQPKKHLGKVQTGQNFDGAHYLIPSVERTASILFRAAALELAFVTFARSYGLQSSRRTLVQHHGLLVSSHRRCLGPLRSETGGFCDLLE